jgi:hypothetical protein
VAVLPHLLMSWCMLYAVITNYRIAEVMSNGITFVPNSINSDHNFIATHSFTRHSGLISLLLFFKKGK